MFNTVAEANQKLGNTTIMRGTSRLESEPVIVLEARGHDGAVVLSIRKYMSDQIERIAINDPSLSVKDLGQRLGYVNIDYQNCQFVAYSRRTPVRRSNNTQGLSDSNVRIDRVNGFPVQGVAPIQFRFSHMETRGIKNTLEQKYPSLAQVKYQMARKETILEMAFGHSLAVSRDSKGLFKLNYKGREVGWSDDLESFKVSSEWQYLEPLMDENKMKIKIVS